MIPLNKIAAELDDKLKDIREKDPSRYKQLLVEFESILGELDLNLSALALRG